LDFFPKSEIVRFEMMNLTTLCKLPRRAVFLALPVLLACAAASAARAQANVDVQGFYAVNRAQQGRAVQAAIVLDIPEGYHVNANKVLNKFSIATTVKLEAPEGVRLSAVSYPAGHTRKLKFSNDPLSLYEGRAIIRFTATFPANTKIGETEIKARVRYQACNDELCYPPVNRDITMPIAVVAPNEQVKPINRQFFGGGRR
jgi:DsbC/DsbD-like thiol-disulfide interchange protein